VTTSIPDFALVLVVSLFGLVLACELLRNHGTRFDLMTIVSIVFLLGYGVAPIGYAIYGVPALLSFHLNAPPPYFLTTAALFSVLAYCVLFGGYLIGNRPRTQSPPQIFGTPSARSIAITLGIIGIICFCVYAAIYGGIIGLFKMAPRIRAGLYVAHSRWVSADRFMGFAAFGLWAVCSKGALGNRPIVRGTLFVTFAGISLAAALATAGRATAVIYLLPVLLVWITRGQLKIPLVTGALLLIAFVLWVDWGKLIAQFLAGNHVIWEQKYGASGRFLQEYYPMYISVPESLNHYYQTGFIQGLSDLASAVRKLMPQHLSGTTVSVSSSKDLNTLLVGAVGRGGRPPGLIAWSIYAAGPGLFLLPTLMYGILLGLLDRRYRPDNVRRDAFAFCVYLGIGAYATVGIVMVGDPTVYLPDLVWLVVGVVLTEFVVRFRNRHTAGRAFERLADLPRPEAIPSV
jgi:hypothetical protein